jgi:hypothetical protein
MVSHPIEDILYQNQIVSLAPALNTKIYPRAQTAEDRDMNKKALFNLALGSMIMPIIPSVRQKIKVKNERYEKAIKAS